PHRQYRRLKQPQIRQIAPERGRQLAKASPGIAEVARSLFCFQIAPTLKCAPWLPLGRDRLRLEHQPAALDALLVAERPNVEDALPDLHVAADHPVERAAIDQLLRSLGCHPGDVAMQGLPPGL